jgi:hypothetical protein
MKFKTIQSLVVFVLLFAFSSCDKDCPIPQPNGIRGEWTWLRSEMGIGGPRITPESEGITRHLVIDDFYYTEFVNDSMVLKSQFDIHFYSDTSFSPGTYLQLTAGSGYAYELIENELQLVELCFGCYIHTYERK